MAHTEEDAKESEREYEVLKTAWFRFVDEVTNGINYERHSPPALFTACMKIVESQTNIDLTETGTNPMIGLPMQTMADYGATMFIFGQFCMRDGILSSNMVPCGCDVIDDKELEKFIDNG
jgi:hypothetical protein